MSKPVLDGTTVVSIGTGMPPAFSTMILRDHGARVLRVEPPGGDRLRTDYPTAFLVWDRGKESVVIDLRTEDGQREARRLARAADIVIESLASGSADRFGIGAGRLRREDPALIYCSIKGFGTKGAYARIPGYDAIVAAKAGRLQPPSDWQGESFVGPPNRPGPMFSNFADGTVGACHMAVQGILSALLVRERTGRGQYVESTIYQGLNPYDMFGMIWWHLRVNRPELIRAGQNAMSIGGGHWCTKDGRWVEFSSMLQHQFRATLHALELEHLWDDPRFAPAPYFEDVEYAEGQLDVIMTRFRERTLAEWMPRLLAEEDVAFEVLVSGEEALDHPQAVHMSSSVVIDDPRVGPIRQTAALGTLSENEASVGTPAPELDAHDPFEPRQPASASSTATADAPPHPLAGVTIVELAHFYAAPFATNLLAALGARVIKVEDLAGDPWRHFRAGTGATKTLEGKESLALDLRTSEGGQLLAKVLARADMFVFGLRPRIAARLGVDYETVSKINPRLVYFSATGYGPTGPYADRAMYGNTTLAMSGGFIRQAGEWMDPKKVEGRGIDEVKDISRRITTQIAAGQDPPAALGRASLMLIALLEQRRTGRGQYVEASMVNMNAHANADDYNSYEGKPSMPLPDPDGYGLHALYRLYAARDGWVFLAITKQREWVAFCDATKPDLCADRRFLEPSARRTNDAALERALSALFAMRNASEWEIMLLDRGVACVRVETKTYAEFSCTDPVIRETGLVGVVEHPTYGRHLRHGLPTYLSETPGKLAPECLLGEHTDMILAELGYGDDEIESLRATAVVGGPRTGPLAGNA